MTPDQLAHRPSAAPDATSAGTPVTHCRGCGSADLHLFLSLGATPIANALVDPALADIPQPAYPLEVGFCTECALVQVLHELPAEVIFGHDYPYFSSFSDQLVRHSSEHVDALVAERSLGADSFVVEIASNDGYLLRRFVERGVPVLGIEPTPGPAAAARAAGVPTLEAFFGDDLAARLVAEHGHADVVIANNVMAHVPDLNGFVAGLVRLAGPDGVVHIENPGVLYLLEHVEFDTVYHEHFCYFSTIAVERLFRRHGLRLLDVTHFPGLHGGTLRWTGGRDGTPTPDAHRFLEEERSRGLDTIDAYADFGACVARNQADLVALLSELRAGGATIAAYGAAAKGATLLNSTGIGAETIDFVVDRNPHKQDKLVPGARIPVLPTEALLERMPSHVLLLAWNFAEEIMQQQQEYRRRGGRFIVPVPQPQIV